jgi:hypothetical protein
VRGGVAFLIEVVDLVILLLLPSFSFAVRLPQAIK